MEPDPQWYLDNVLAYASPGVVEPIAPPGPIASWQAGWAAAVRGVDSPLHRLAVAQGFVLTLDQLWRAGWQPHELRREVRRGTWSRPGRGVAAPLAVRGDDPDAKRRRHALAAAAAVLVRPEHVICGRSAAILHGLPTMRVPPLPELTTTDSGWRGRRSRAVLRSSGLGREECATWYGAPVTGVARTLVDLGRHNRRDAIMAVDAALRESAVTEAALAEALDRARGWPGVRAARDVLALGSVAAESPLESIVRLALHDDGFPPSRLQFALGGFRVDFCWPDVRLILEADGRVKYTGDALWAEKQREARLRALGYRVERVLWRDVTRDWPATSARLRPYFARLPRP